MHSPPEWSIIDSRSKKRRRAGYAGFFRAYGPNGDMITDFIWDFDGMLFDTYPHTMAAFCETARRHGLSLDPGEVYEYAKVTLWHAFRQYGFTEAMVEEFYGIENDLSFPPHGKPFPMVPETLRLVKKSGGRNFLYTHRDRVALVYLENFGLTDCFTDCVTREQGFPNKPAPDAIEDLCRRHGLNKASVFMCGDRDIDILAGINAGVGTLLFDTEARYGDIGETRRADGYRTLYETVLDLLS